MQSDAAGAQQAAPTREEAVEPQPGGGPVLGMWGASEWVVLLVGVIESERALADGDWVQQAVDLAQRLQALAQTGAGGGPPSGLRLGQ